MTIAIQKGHEQLKQSLIRHGFNVVTYGEYTGIVDALLYAGSLEGSALQTGNFKQSTGPADTQPTGIFMLNIENKSVDEIAAMLSRRLYSPLF